MSRTTLVHRQETEQGARFEWGHLFVRVDGKPGQQRFIVPGEHDEKGNERGQMRLSPEHANVMSDLLRAAYVNAGSSCGGQSLYDMMWDEMMAVTDRLIGDGDQADPDDVGGARMLAWVIAVMQNPYLPNVDAVREQVMERWEREDRTPEPTPPASAQRRPRVTRRRRA